MQDSENASNPSPDQHHDRQAQSPEQANTSEPSGPNSQGAEGSVLDTTLDTSSYYADATARQAFAGTLSATVEAKDDSNVRYRLEQSQWNALLPEAIRHYHRPGSLLGDEVARTASKFPFGTGRAGDIDSLLATLPPRRHCDYLIKQYFACFSPLFHILHDPTFLAEYSTFTQNPKAVKLSWLALLFTLLALAITTLDDQDAVLVDLGPESDGGNNIKALAGRFRAGAMNALAADQFLVKHNLTTLQALILLIYAINHSEGAAKSMALLGMRPGHFSSFSLLTVFRDDGQYCHRHGLSCRPQRPGSHAN
jgi:hypothetical protein